MTRFHVLFDAIVIVAVTALIHISINQSYTIDMADQRNRINEDQIRELISKFVQIGNAQDLELAQGQGKIEGIISVVTNKESVNHYDSVWHNGYYQGLDQVAYTDAILKDEDPDSLVKTKE